MGKTGSCSDGRAMLSNSLIQFLLMGGAVFLHFLPTELGQTMVGVMVVMVVSFERTYASMPQLLGLL